MGVVRVKHPVFVPKSIILNWYNDSSSSNNNSKKKKVILLKTLRRPHGTTKTTITNKKKSYNQQEKQHWPLLEWFRNVVDQNILKPNHFM